MSQYYITKNKYLSESLSYLGFTYYKFTNVDEVIYSFIQTPKLDIALKELSNLKNVFR